MTTKRRFTLMDMLSVSVQDSCESLISYLTNLANKKGAKEGH